MARIEHPARRVQRRLHPLAEIVREFIRGGRGGDSTHREQREGVSAAGSE